MFNMKFRVKFFSIQDININNYGDQNSGRFSVVVVFSLYLSTERSGSRVARPLPCSVMTMAKNKITESNTLLLFSLHLLTKRRCVILDYLPETI